MKKLYSFIVLFVLMMPGWLRDFPIASLPKTLETFSIAPLSRGGDTFSWCKAIPRKADDGVPSIGRRTLGGSLRLFSLVSSAPDVQASAHLRPCNAYPSCSPSPFKSCPCQRGYALIFAIT